MLIVLKRFIMAETDIVRAIACVREKIKCSFDKSSHKLQTPPRLVAVSKTKPKELIIAAYNTGQYNFGENYVQELIEKGNDPEVLELCPNVKWHFIGHLQSNKCSKIVSVPNLFMIETVDSEKLANSLNQSWGKLGKDYSLKIMIQINTSGEEEKSGCAPENALNLIKHVQSNCSNLELSGLMTIGKFGYDMSLGPNPDFLKLAEVRKNVCDALSIPVESMEMSMGMSDDFEHAIELGSTNVRVGSSIFGSRTKK